MRYPINLNLENRKCLVIGGGKVAERKILRLVDANADITVISPVITEKLAELAEQKRISWINDVYRKGATKGYFLLIAATNNKEANFFAICEAKKYNVLVNAPDNPELSDFSAPAVARRGDLLITVATEDISPAFSRIIKEEILDFLPKNIDEWLKVLKRIRGEMKEKLNSSREREFFWREALNKRVFELLKEDKLKDAEVELENVISRNRTKS